MAAIVDWEQLESVEAYAKAMDTAIEPALRGAPPIAVLGAGISGLVAAYELGRKGYAIDLYEASGRIGGRILTNRFESAHAELGAMRVPGKHWATRYYAETVTKQRLVPFANTDVNALAHVRGATYSLTDKDGLLAAFDLNDAESGRIRDHGLQGLLLPFLLLARDLTHQEQNDIALSRIATSTDRVKALDAQTIRDYLYRDPATEAYSSEGLEWLANVNYLKDIWNAPLTALLKELLQDRSSNLGQIDSGMDQLPDQMLKQIREQCTGSTHIHTHKEIVGIDNSKSGVSLRYRDTRDESSEPHQQSYGFVLSTLPFGVMRQLRLEGISQSKLATIDRFQYARSTKVLLHFKAKFWEALANPIFGGASVTDQIASQIFYPTNQQCLQDTGSDGGDPYPVILPGGSASQGTRRAQLPVLHPEPGVLIGSYCWGTNADRLGALSHAGRLEVVLNCLRDLHGSVVDEAFAGTGASMAWGTHRWSAGAFGQPAPRQLQLFRHDAMSAEGRLFVSGEHLSNDPGWINGSINSTLGAITRLAAAARSA